VNRAEAQRLNMMVYLQTRWAGNENADNGKPVGPRVLARGSAASIGVSRALDRQLKKLHHVPILENWYLMQ
jgi:hypothetical protein